MQWNEIEITIAKIEKSRVGKCEIIYLNVVFPNTLHSSREQGGRFFREEEEEDLDKIAITRWRAETDWPRRRFAAFSVSSTKKKTSIYKTAFNESELTMLSDAEAASSLYMWGEWGGDDVYVDACIGIASRRAGIIRLCRSSPLGFVLLSA